MPKISTLQRELRREHFIAAALRCISRRGITGTSMSDITKEADSSAGDLYLYFTTKDDLIRAVFTCVFESVVQLVEEAIGSVPVTSPAFMDTLLRRVTEFRMQPVGADFCTLVLQGWSHSSADQVTGRIVSTQTEILLSRLADACSDPGNSEIQRPGRIAAVLFGAIVLHALKPTVENNSRSLVLAWSVGLHRRPATPADERRSSPLAIQFHLASPVTLPPDRKQRSALANPDLDSGPPSPITVPLVSAERAQSAARAADDVSACRRRPMQKRTGQKWLAVATTSPALSGRIRLEGRLQQ